MSEKDKKMVDEAFRKVRGTHIDHILNNPPLGPDAHTYTHEFSDYSEGRYQPYLDGSEVSLRESARSKDASIKLVQHRYRPNEDQRAAGEKPSDHTRIDSSVTLPTTTGEVSYASNSLGLETTHDANTKIIRKDKDGNEVYRFTSKNPEMADKVGAVAAKRIIDGVQENNLDKAA